MAVSAKGDTMKPIYLLPIIAVGLLTSSSAKAENEAAAYWKLRAMNYIAIARHRALGEMTMWCVEESDKQHPDNTGCDTVAEQGGQTEADNLASRKATEQALDSLKGESQTPTNLEHIKVLSAQLAELKALPTPFHDMAAKKQ